ncbi:terminase small subunit [Ferruginibacter paludis]|uniref:terminase small subunit n=1 Tax=Ferruginibacter paludis TaxID=1310417 RepID=UPI0025B331DA|nr:terminase small subunit [Ferruginibacter paludis]MDN3657957.1 terminase small subunit [Ferruginibacter paludis]
MGAKKNAFWKLRSSHGREKIFSDPSILLEAAGEYFDHVDRLPWFRVEPIKSGDKAGKLVKVPCQRPYTLSALCHFLDIHFTTWQLYKERPDFKQVVENIEEFIYNQKLEGSLVGAFNANIIARHLGLVERTDRTSKGDSISGSFLHFLKETGTVDEEHE